jgi:hypothetical protein
LYFVGTFIIAFCACGGFAVLSYFMNR